MFDPRIIRLLRYSHMVFRLSSDISDGGPRNLVPEAQRELFHFSDQ